MNLLIVTHVLHKRRGNQFYAYGPYVREINLWMKQAASVQLVAPLDKKERVLAIDIPYDHSDIHYSPVPAFNIRSVPALLKAFFDVPRISLVLYVAIRRSDHIHLRCPGNMGLLGLIIQLFFPGKLKSAKYAGNWDPKSKQPLSYSLQKYLLNSTFFCRNMQVLVYGHWPGSGTNIRSSFTASYREEEKQSCIVRKIEKDKSIRLIFSGALEAWKQPMISLKVAHDLYQKGFPVEIHFYGEGKQRQKLQSYIDRHQLKKIAYLHGNVHAGELKEAYAQCHFLLLFSKSEGWPKAIAEAMFWACLPFSSGVSCVPEMLGEGERGEVFTNGVDTVAERIQWYLDHPEIYRQRCQAAMGWSRQFTMERFQTEIENVYSNNLNHSINSSY